MIIRADARALPLRDGCVDCCVTSPPYFGLRDYGDARQLGLEATPEAYVAALVAVCREVGRVLKDGGTLWLNLGDSYNSAASNQNGGGLDGRVRGGNVERGRNSRVYDGLQTKQLLGIPWRVAFALQADGWYLRADIIWHKPNPMPESVTDRPTKAHEYVFLLAKSARYYYDARAIADVALTAGGRGGFCGAYGGYQSTAMNRKPSGNQIPANNARYIRPETRNKRSVWTVGTQPYDGAHFATFPEALIEPCILAGCPEGGLVLDPFVGSGTVGAVAERYGRRWVGTDLTYQALARERTAQRGLMFV